MEKTGKKIQQEYYSRTASKYDDMHLQEGCDREHDFALAFLSSMIELYRVRSVLDLGAGTGRTITYLKNRFPDLHVIGVEPVAELREMGYAKGISNDILIDGDGMDLKFQDSSFDLVCEFAVLHHVPKPDKVVAEMLRVSAVGVFISDSNNFGQGGKPMRIIKQIFNAFKVWKFFDLVRTRGKGYHISEGDGLFYSYSVFDNYDQIKKSCKDVFIVNTKHSDGINPYRNASHVALLGIKN